MAREVVRPALHLAWLHRLRAGKTFDLRLLIDAEQRRLGWCIPIAADDISDFLDESRIAARSTA